jgi:hypothetical protein
MNTRERLPTVNLSSQKRCVYCPNPADTNDHAPPKALLRRPLPSNLITLPACRSCNSGFSFDEQVVRIIVTLSSLHPELVAARGVGGEVSRAFERNRKLQALFERNRNREGDYVVGAEILSSFERVAFKTVQGLFYGLYRRLIARNELKLLCVGDLRLTTAEEIVDELRPSPLDDITDEPVSEITPNSWHSREPIFLAQLTPVAGEPPINRIFHLTRESPPVWEAFQPGIFRYTFVKREGGGGACVMELWETTVIAVAVPWPDDRGPLRRGRRNPMSRDNRA